MFRRRRRQFTHANEQGRTTKSRDMKTFWLKAEVAVVAGDGLSHGADAVGVEWAQPRVEGAKKPGIISMG